MCGIVGYIGKERAIPKILNSLKFLEYRGYDSSGIAYVKNNKVNIIKEVGKIKALENILDINIDSKIGLGHTRWATHGGPSVKNSHPHKVGKFTVVHNGIIENYLEIKNELLKNNIEFKSDTDTEVIPALLDFYYRSDKNILSVIKKTINRIKGSYAVGIICEDDINHLYAFRCGSPLIVAKDDSGYYIASDVPAILSFTNKYIILEENEIAVLESNRCEFYNLNLNKIKKEIKVFEGTYETIMLNGYDHYMLKEIHEEGKVFLDTLNYYVKDNSFKDTMINLKKYKRIHIVGCGSAYYVGLIGEYLISEFANIEVTCEVASEYRYKKVFYNDSTLVIIISQSGETADSLAALRMAKENHVDTLAIVNVVGSSISREADYTLYVKAGPEIAVATTKAFLAQATLLSLLAIKLSGKLELLKELNGIENKIEYLLNLDYRDYAKEIYNHDNVFYIGRLIDYALCQEGALKLKETSYINALAISSGELKHGTISLINDNTRVVGICTKKEIMSKTISNLKEIKSRGAYVIFITNEDIEDDFYDKKIIIPKVHDIIEPILTVIPLQLIAYNVAKYRGCDIDKPRNLAKSVTVE